jgi:serine/threonine protein kinase
VNGIAAAAACVTCAHNLNVLCCAHDGCRAQQIGDMGLSTVSTGQSGIKGKKMQGTLPWMAPEQFVGGGMGSMRRGNAAAHMLHAGSTSGGGGGGGSSGEFNGAACGGVAGGAGAEERPPWLEPDAPWPEPGAINDSGRDMAFTEDDEEVTSKVDVYSFAVSLLGYVT